MLFDIAFNGTSKEFASNLDKIIENARNAEVMPIFVGLDLQSSEKSLDLAKKYNTCCYLGVHPLTLEKYEETKKGIEKLEFNDDNVCGIGECGLDYFRSEKKDEQIELFKEHLKIQKLPYFYHCRNSFTDFFEILIAQKSFKVFQGVVHSFDGSLDEANMLISKGLYIGINGCSLKSKEGIEVVKHLPLNRIVIETDSPYCLVRKSYTGSEYTDPIKSKYNEPAFVRQIAEIISKIKNIKIEEFEKILYENTLNLFPKLKNFVKFWE